MQQGLNKDYICCHCTKDKWNKVKNNIIDYYVNEFDEFKLKINGACGRYRGNISNGWDISMCI